MTLLEPWILARLAAGIVATALLAHAAWVSARVLRFFRLGATSEGQLALERQAELAAASARVGAVLQTGALLLSVIAADQLTGHLRGAMCGHGVVHAVEAGPAALVSSLLAAVAALVLGHALDLDRQTRTLALARPLALVTLLAATTSLVDLGLTASWLGALDFSVVASCCSAGLDAGGASTARASSALVSPALAALAVLAALALSLVARRAPRRPWTLAAGAAALLAAPLSALAIPQRVAPYVYEVPQHRCAYCLFRADALWFGYLIFGTLLLATSATLGAALAALLAPSPDDLARFAPPRLRRAAALWGLLLLLALAPVVRYLVLSGGVPLRG